jgi:hypothetical protein
MLSPFSVAASSASFEPSVANKIFEIKGSLISSRLPIS